jgi:phosphoribosylformimino-5-aminoimidazole carboxamide ribotide isomerase
MEIIPAIDIRNGNCVRLYQGDYGIETIFSDDPVEMAMKWQSLGALRLHIIDLDGAASGGLCNLQLITEITNAVLIPVQVGGGIRQMRTIEELLKVGVDRVILGTAAVENAELVKEACYRFGPSIIVSLDAREGYLATHGWKQETELKAIEFVCSMIKLKVRRFIYTDISRDGTLTEPNFNAIFELVDTTRCSVVASGGISSLTHLKVLKKLGVNGAIIGKALYTEQINLKQALNAVSEI